MKGRKEVNELVQDALNNYPEAKRYRERGYGPFLCSNEGCNNELLHRVEIINEQCDDCLFPLEEGL